MKKTWILIFGSCFILLATCRKDIYSPNACFKEDVLPVFVSNCTFSGCHNSVDKAEEYDLSNYNGIMHGIKPYHPLQSEIYNVIKGKNPSMPPEHYQKLNSDDLYTIKLWIEMGALDNANCKACDTSNYTFSNRVKPTMQTWCVGCHSSNSPAGGFDLSHYNGVVNSIANNKLMGSLKHLSGFSPMPKNTNQLQQCEIDAIEKWVNAGHPNN